MNKLTPVQSVGGLLFKRDDLYEPFGPGEVNGGKMRQCMMLLDSVKDEISGVISCCSIHSPQAPYHGSGRAGLRKAMQDIIRRHQPREAAGKPHAAPMPKIRRDGLACHQERPS